MTLAPVIKGASHRPPIVGVIASLQDLHRATRLRLVPDLFELRLDALVHDLEIVERGIANLAAPLITTARHPAEEGFNKLTEVRRRDLLLRFLPHAAYVDIELRSAAGLGPILTKAKAPRIKRIISMHDFRRTPTATRLQDYLHAAQSFAPDIFKIVVRTETADELALLTQFIDHAPRRMKISAMGVGRFGRASRIHFAKHGTALIYAQLGPTHLPGQLSLAQARHCLAR